jgi:uncharacterized membrane protein
VRKGYVIVVDGRRYHVVDVYCYFILGYVFVVILMINILATQVKLAAGHKDLARRRNRIFALAALGTIIASYAVMTAVGMRA